MEDFRDDMRQCMDEFLAVPTDELHQGMVDAMQEFIDHPSCQMALGACVAGLIAGLTDRAVGDDTEDVTRHLNELPRDMANTAMLYLGALEIIRHATERRKQTRLGLG